MREWDQMIARQVAADGVRTTWGEHVAPPGGEVTMTDTRILSREAYAHWSNAHVSAILRGDPAQLNIAAKLDDHDAALRARLTAAEERAEQAERERDEWERAYRNENSLTDGMTCVLHERYHELIGAEAQVRTLTEQLEGFHAECDKVGIPYDPPSLVRHHRNNAAFVVAIEKGMEVRTLREALTEADDLLTELAKSVTGPAPKVIERLLAWRGEVRAALGENNDGT